MGLAEKISAYYREADEKYRRWNELSDHSPYALHCGLHPEGNRTSQRESLQNMTRHLISLSQIKGDETIVDAGCGVGELIFTISNMYPNVTCIGVNIAPSQIKTAQSLRSRFGSQNTQFVIGNYEYLPIHDSEIDFVFFVESSGHASDQLRAFREARRVLKTDGKVVVAEAYLANRDLSHEEEQWLQWYQEGWFIPEIRTQEEFIYDMEEEGLYPVIVEDLTTDVFPSIELMSNHAQLRLNTEDTDSSFTDSRRACVGSYNLTKRGKMKYVASVLAITF